MVADLNSERPTSRYLPELEWVTSWDSLSLSVSFSVSRERVNMCTYYVNMKLRVENELTEICGSLCREEQHPLFVRAWSAHVSAGIVAAKRKSYSKQVSELRSERIQSTLSKLQLSYLRVEARLQRFTRKQVDPKTRRCALGQVGVEPRPR
jgi:hypothetical protein